MPILFMTRRHLSPMSQRADFAVLCFAVAAADVAHDDSRPPHAAETARVQYTTSRCPICVRAARLKTPRYVRRALMFRDRQARDIRACRLRQRRMRGGTPCPRMYSGPDMPARHARDVVLSWHARPTILRQRTHQHAIRRKMFAAMPDADSPPMPPAAPRPRQRRHLFMSPAANDAPRKRRRAAASAYVDIIDADVFLPPDAAADVRSRRCLLMPDVIVPYARADAPRAFFFFFFFFLNRRLMRYADASRCRPRRQQNVPMFDAELDILFGSSFDRRFFRHAAATAPRRHFSPSRLPHASPLPVARRPYLQGAARRRAPRSHDSVYAA